MRFGRQCKPGAQVQGSCVKPPQGPPGPETHRPASAGQVQLASPVSRGQLQTGVGVGEAAVCVCSLVDATSGDCDEQATTDTTHAAATSTNALTTCFILVLQVRAQKPMRANGTNTRTAPRLVTIRRRVQTGRWPLFTFRSRGRASGLDGQPDRDRVGASLAPSAVDDLVHVAKGTPRDVVKWPRPI
jgi:hypothetical protein